MVRIGHGDSLASPVQPDQRLTLAADGMLDAEPKFSKGLQIPDFGYMFSLISRDRPADDDRLPEGPEIIEALGKLADAMGQDRAEPSPMTDRALPGDGTVPAGYTYFGQFIDHDITIVKNAPNLDDEAIIPLTSLDEMVNGRTADLELDSVYGRYGASDNLVPPIEGDRMQVGDTIDAGGDDFGSSFFQVIPGKARENDLPRKGRSEIKEEDRAALVGDPRNDENLIVAQMHVAFLKAHNTLADQLRSFKAAREALILMYQSVVVDDFLPRICDAATLASILADGQRFFTPASQNFMPIEFSAAGFRFGHSMVRQAYDFNRNFAPADSRFMFTFSALSGNLAGAGVDGDPEADPDKAGEDKFPHNWVIQWERFLAIGGATPQRARPIDTQLTPILMDLRDTFGNKQSGNIAPRLAARNLLRGYQLSLPTGQAVAAKIGIEPLKISAETTGLAEDVLKPFVERTPLWLYVLAEARTNNGKLGVVGTTIVAETLITQVMRSKPSIFDNRRNRISDARHTLVELIALAGVQDTQAMTIPPAAP